MLQKSVVEIATETPCLVWAWVWGLLFLRARAWHGMDEHSRTTKECSELLHTSLHLHPHPLRSSSPGKEVPLQMPYATLGYIDPFTWSELFTEDF